MAAIPRYRAAAGGHLLSAGFRPFFLLSGVWACVAIPLWLAIFAGDLTLPSSLAPAMWHVHEMAFGYGLATVAGFMLTAVPNWTGRMPLQGPPLAGLVALWIAGRLAMLGSDLLGELATACLDLAFPLVFLGVIAREIIAGRNWRNLPMLGALSVLLGGNLLVHLGAFGDINLEAIGNRIGVATLVMLITLMGGRIIPSFTRNWLVKQRPDVAAPAPFGVIDRVTLGVTALALVAWVALPDSAATAWAALAAALTNAIRVGRWRGVRVLREPLLWVLHVGYGWLAAGFLLLAASHWVEFLPQTAALHALTVGAIGTMTLAVMTRASLGHTGRPLVAGPGTTAIFLLVTLAAVLRLLAPLGGEHYLLLLAVAGTAWSAAFGLFVLLYGPPLSQPRVRGEAARPI
jgi:uncharacterized protein involved in response to NO